MAGTAPECIHLLCAAALSVSASALAAEIPPMGEILILSFTRARSAASA